MIEQRFSRLDQWLSWLETLHPSKIDLGLDRISTVAARLGIKKPQATTVVTVAGTNGKGSCVASLETLLRDGDHSVGAYTSPHILQYGERVKVNAVVAKEEEICNTFARIDAARQDISLTYFEFGTLAALLIFSQHELDFWVLEVGLGGRLDAVNIIAPDIAVISSIDLDHQAWLGDTRDQIAREKLGILRPKTPCVCAETRLTDSMIRIFEQLDTRLLLRGREFSYLEKDSNLDVAVTSLTGEIVRIQVPCPNMSLSSLSAAIQVLALCDKLPTQTQIQRSLPRVQLTGRFQKVATENADFILDVAHNPAACALLADKLSKYPSNRFIALVGMMNDKQIGESLAPLCRPIDEWHVTEFPGLTRSAGRYDLVKHLRALAVNDEKIHAHADIQSALDVMAETETDPRTTILVFGSFHTVAGALEYLKSVSIN